MATLNLTSWCALRRLLLDDALPAQTNLVQEHHLDGEGCARARVFGRICGWEVDLLPAKASGNGAGLVGGVGVAVRLGTGLRRLDKESVGHIWEDGCFADERLGFWEVNAWVPGGYVASPLYLQTGTGPEIEERNLGYLDILGETLRSLRRPFVIGGDWQRTPGEIPAGWVQAVGGEIVAAGQPTCVNYFAAREIDFFIASQELAAKLGDVNLNDGVAIRPHRCVQAFSSAGAARLKVRTMRKAKAIPISLPFGPLKKPLDSTDLLAEIQGEVAPEDVGNLTTKVVEFVEKQLLHARDMEETAGYTGRAKGPKFRWTDAGRRKIHGEASVPLAEEIWRRLADRLTQWSALCRKARSTKSKNEAANLRCQAKSVWRKMMVAKSPVPGAGEAWSEAWEHWRRERRKISEDRLEQTATLLAWLRRLAARAEAAAAKKRGKDWRKWATDSVSQEGGKKAFRWIKEAPCWKNPPVEEIFEEQRVDENGKPEKTDKVKVVVCDNQRAAEKETQPWHKLWRRDAAKLPLVWPKVSRSEVLELLPTPEEARATSKRFSPGTALGADIIHPRHLATLDEGSVVLVVAWWALVLWAGEVGGPAALVLVPMIPRPDGAKRPVGLFNGLIRPLVGWLRSSAGAVFSEASDRKFFFGVANRSIEQGVWTSGASAEMARAQGKDGGTAFADISKAYENISFQDLQEKAIDANFNVIILRFLIGLYRQGRVILHGEVASSICFPANGVIAGCNFADMMMRIVLLPILDRIVENWPRRTVAEKVCLTAVGVVDDVQLHVVGPCKLAAATLAGAFAELAGGLVKARLPLNKKKLAATGTSKSFLEELSAASPLLKGAEAESTRNLGHDYGDGRMPGVEVKNARLRRVRKWLPKIRRLRKAGANTRRLVLGAVKPALQFGTSTSFPRWRYISAAGSLAHSSLYQTPRGRVVTIGLALAPGGPADPRPALLANPLVALASACWESWLPRQQIWRTWSTASEQAKAQGIGTKHLRYKPEFAGPIASGLAAARRLGWQPSSPGKLLTKRHAEIDLCEVCPATIKTLAERDGLDLLLEDEVEKHFFLSGLDGGIPFIDASRALLAGKQKQEWGAEERSVYRTLVTNGIWTEDRLWAAGFVENGGCKACGEAASIMHRWSCPALARKRHDMGISRRMLAEAQEHQNLSNPLWSHGIVADPLVAAPLPLLTSRVCWEVPPPAGHFEGTAFGDGSGLHPRFARRIRCGWAVATVATDRFGKCWVTASAFGPLPGLLQTVPAAEACALLMFLAFAGPGKLAFVTDCAWVISCLAAGPAGTTGSMHRHAEIWREIWKKVADIGGLEFLTVSKIKAHTAKKSVQAGTLEAERRFGNEAADRLAKMGAAQHPVSQLVERRADQAIQTAEVVGKTLATLHLAALKNGTDTTPKRDRRRRQGATRGIKKTKAFKHTLVECGQKRVRCATCWRSGASKGVVERRVCSPGVGHSLVTLGTCVLCWRCGAFSRGSAILLLQKCRGHPVKKNSHGHRALAKARKGICPATNKPLGEEAFVPVATQFLEGLALRGVIGATRRLSRKTRVEYG